jgi:hypothetical protein
MPRPKLNTPKSKEVHVRVTELFKERLKIACNVDRRPESSAVEYALSLYCDEVDRQNSIDSAGMAKDVLGIC